MGIVHHSNYLRFCEEARIQWCLKYGAMSQHNVVSEGRMGGRFENQSVFALTVLETRVQHKKALKYPEQISVNMKAYIDGIKIVFNYEIVNGLGEVCAFIETTHCSVNEKLKPVRLTQELRKAVEQSSMDRHT